MISAHSEDPQIVLYIGGEGRSGSTILSALLANSDEYCCVGELHGVWDAVLTNELCGCGSPFHACEFWRSVGAAAFGGWDRTEAKNISLFSAELVRQRYVGRLAIPVLRRRYTPIIDRYTSILRRLLEGLRRTSGADVVVDSSKGFPYALISKLTAGVDLRVVHLVRDPRGVAFSWAKRGIPQPQYAGHPRLRSTTMDRRGSCRSAARWLAANLAFETLGHFGVRRVRLLYEDVARDPRGALSKVDSLVSEVGDSSIDRRHRNARDLVPVPHHGIGGNPIRFSLEGAAIRVDDSWRREFPLSSRLSTTAITLPLLVAYGYCSPAAGTASKPQPGQPHDSHTSF